MKGKVFLVGAGPGDPELLTVKALRLLQSADVILHDDLISSDILELAPKTAHVRSVGKRCGRKKIHQEEINTLLIAYASFGLKVLRLKSGDPLLFGRAGEEIEALRRANVEFEVVPGVTSASASAAALGASLTYRSKASAVVFLTSHQASNGSPEWQTHVRDGATLAIYMPGSDYRCMASELVAAGIALETPCAIVSQASMRTQQIHRTTIQGLPDAHEMPAPTILLVGKVFESRDADSRGLADGVAPATDDTSFSLPTLEIFADSQIFGLTRS
jgi:uroporphyrin-III C-methyltransferase